MTPGFDRDEYVRLAAFFHVSPAVFVPAQLQQPTTIYRGEPPLVPTGQVRTGGQAVPRR